MSYQHILQLIKDPDILLFLECWALEKLHGTSAKVTFRAGQTCVECGGNGKTRDIQFSERDPCRPCGGSGKIAENLHFFSGHASNVVFQALFDIEKLKANLRALGYPDVKIHGEAYGGKQQGMKATYGNSLRFTCFEVQIGEEWLDVERADKFVTDLGLEFVPYRKIPATMEAINAERDADSVQAVRNGCGPGHIREGVVLRPLKEFIRSDGSRIIAKHRRKEFSETAEEQDIIDPARVKVLEDAIKIADFWVVPNRLQHVLSHLPTEKRTLQSMRDIINAMVEDVYREAKGEIVESKAVAAAIGKRTVKLFQEAVQRGHVSGVE